MSVTDSPVDVKALVERLRAGVRSVPGLPNILADHLVHCALSHDTALRKILDALLSAQEEAARLEKDRDHYRKGMEIVSAVSRQNLERAKEAEEEAAGLRVERDEVRAKLVATETFRVEGEQKRQIAQARAEAAESKLADAKCDLDNIFAELDTTGTGDAPSSDAVVAIMTINSLWRNSGYAGAMRAKLADAVGVLEPFANLYDQMKENGKSDEREVYGYNSATLLKAHFRAARAFLTSIKEVGDAR